MSGPDDSEARCASEAKEAIKRLPDDWTVIEVLAWISYLRRATYKLALDTIPSRDLVVRLRQAEDELTDHVFRVPARVVPGPKGKSS